MTPVDNFFHSYATMLDFIPPDIRFLLSVAIVIILIILFVKYISKSVFWLVIFILLVPTAYPAIREIILVIYNKIIQPLIK